MKASFVPSLTVDYTEKFSMSYYAGFLQIESHTASYIVFQCIAMCNRLATSLQWDHRVSMKYDTEWERYPCYYIHKTKLRLNADNKDTIWVNGL